MSAGQSPQSWVPTIPHIRLYSVQGLTSGGGRGISVPTSLQRPTSQSSSSFSQAPQCWVPTNPHSILYSLQRSVVVGSSGSFGSGVSSPGRGMHCPTGHCGWSSEQVPHQWPAKKPHSTPSSKHHSGSESSLQGSLSSEEVAVILGSACSRHAPIPRAKAARATIRNNVVLFMILSSINGLFSRPKSLSISIAQGALKRANGT